MRLSEYLQSQLVILDLATRGVEDTIRALVRRLAEADAVEQADIVEKVLLEREAIHTTSLGNGVALPHATVSGLDHPVILVAVSPEGVAFGDDDPAEPDRLFFMLLSPLNQAGTHIKLLARIVRLVRRSGFVEALLAAETGDELIATIERVDAQRV